jgi:hypothetical protein
MHLCLLWEAREYHDARKRVQVDRHTDGENSNIMVGGSALFVVRPAYRSI